MSQNSEDIIEKSIEESPEDIAEELLINLSPSQFSRVVFRYKIPKYHLPNNATQYIQAVALIAYALQQEGKSLKKLFKVIEKVQSERGNSQNLDNRLQISVPELLPYCANRNEQIGQLDEGLSDSKNIKRPIISIVHGDDSQAPYYFMRCIQKKYLSELLQNFYKIKGLSEPKPFVIHDVPWPENLRELNNFHHRFKQKLARSIFETEIGIRSKTIEDINSKLDKYAPTVLIAKLSCEDLSKYKIKIIYAFLEFWKKWPQLNSRQMLMIFLVVESRENSDSVMRRIKKKFLAEKDANISQELDEIQELKLQDYNCIVLPELESVGQTEVENWAKSKSAKDFCGEQKTTRLEEEIGDKWGSWVKGKKMKKLPMDALASELRKLLEDIYVMN